MDEQLISCWQDTAGDAYINNPSDKEHSNSLPHADQVLQLWALLRPPHCLIEEYKMESSKCWTEVRKYEQSIFLIAKCSNLK